MICEYCEKVKSFRRVTRTKTLIWLRPHQKVIRNSGKCNLEELQTIKKS